MQGYGWGCQCPRREFVAVDALTSEPVLAAVALVFHHHYCDRECGVAEVDDFHQAEAAIEAAVEAARQGSDSRSSLSSGEAK